MARTRLDPDNPAVAVHTALPPQLIDDVTRDPDALQPVMRAMYAVQLDAAHRALLDPSVTMPHRIAFMEHLAKNSRLTPKQVSDPMQSLGGFQVNIFGPPAASGALPRPEKVIALETSELPTVSGPDNLSDLTANVEAAPDDE